MAGHGSPGGRKGPARVEVIYFPKRVRPPHRQAREQQEAGSASRTLEFQPDFGEAPVGGAPESGRKAPHLTPTEEVPAQVEEPAPRRKAALPGAAGERTSKGRWRITLEVDTDPALRYHVAKLDELLKSQSAGPLRSLSHVQLAEMALFGHQLFEFGRLEEARVVFEGLVALDVEDAFPHTMLGTVYLALGKPDRAFALFEAALAIDPEDIAARVYRAEIRLNRGQRRNALEELAEVIAHGPVDDPFVDRARRLMQIAAGARRRGW